MQKNDWTKIDAGNDNGGSGAVRFDIPGGAYVMEIIDVEDKTNSNGKPYLRLIMDVADGPYKGFAEAAEEARGNDWSYKKVDIYYTGKAENCFKRFLDKLEDSNRRFDIAKWQVKSNEKDFKGYLIGVVFDEEIYNGKCVTKASPFKIYSVDEIEDGKFKEPILLTEEKFNSLDDRLKKYYLDDHPEFAKTLKSQPENSPILADENIPF